MKGWKRTGVVVGLAAMIVSGGQMMAWADSKGGHGHSGMKPHGGKTYTDNAHSGSDYGDMAGHHGGLSPLDMKEALGLSEEQVTQLRPVELDYRKAMIQNGADLRVAMIDLGNLLDAKDLDKAVINAKVDEIGALQKNMMMYRVDVLLKVKSILNADQYDQFRTTLRQRMEGMSHHMGSLMKKGAAHDSGVHP